VESKPGEVCFSAPATTTTTSTVPVTTTITPTTTTTSTSPSSYKVSISPLSATIASGSTLQFTAKTTYGGEEVAGTYNWEIVPASTISSYIDSEGLYTAGDNTTSADIEETIKVTDTEHQNKSATAVVTIKKKEEPPPECEVTINPSAASVYPGDTLMLSALTTGTCETPQFQWSLKNSDTNSSIEPQGATCIYTAGANEGTEPLTDTIMVTDTVNQIDAEAQITILAEGVSIEVVTDPLWKSHWIPLPYFLVIKGDDTSFAAFKSVINFDPPTSVLPLLTLIWDAESIWHLLLVMPSWLAGEADQMVTVTVTTEDEVVSDDFMIKLLPFIFDEVKSIK
jgi:hypothetical protein